MGVWGLGLENLHPSGGTPGVGGNLGTSIDVGVLGPDTRLCERSGVEPGKPLSIVVASTLKVYDG